MKQTFVLKTGFLLLIGVIAGFNAATGQSNNYRQTDLVSNVRGLGANVDLKLIGPWGIALSADMPFRVADNGNGWFTSYDANGESLPTQGLVAVPPGATSTSRPTGVVYNPTGTFVAPHSLFSPFLYASEDGTISGEYADTNGNLLPTTILAVDNSRPGAVYTGLAIMTPGCCAPFLAVANFHTGFIDAFTGFFAPLAPPGSFSDPNLPAGYAPYNLQVIGNQLFVTYAVQDSAKHSAVMGSGNGIVDIFDLEGNFVRRFVANGPLNAPWGITKASSSFGAFSNDILIGNSGEGLINAFDPTTGNFLGFLKDGAGNAIVNAGLRGMVFGAGNVGDPNTLYIAANLNGGPLGVFGAISVNATGAVPDFSVTTPSQSATVVAGQSTAFTLTATPIGGFIGSVHFSCSAPGGVTCTFNTTDVNAGAAAGTTVLTVATPAGMAFGTGVGAAGFLFAGIGLFGSGRSRRKAAPALQSRLHRRNRIPVAILLVLLLGGFVGCGSSPAPSPSNKGPVTIQVTAQSGAVSHTIALTVNVQ